jgi:hypothetical protein
LSTKLSHSFYCEKCHYGTSSKSNYNNHLKSIKHTKSDESTLFNGIKPFLSQDGKYKCEKCNKSYKERSGLWRHKKICITPENNSEVIIELLKQNKEFKELIIEQNKELIELSKEKTITNNNCNNNITNNNSFNLNVFLNEQCKDALHPLTFTPLRIENAHGNCYFSLMKRP